MRVGFGLNQAMRVTTVLVAAFLVTACQAPEPLVFDGEAAFAHVVAQTEFGFRPTGSEAGWATGDYIISYLEEQGWAVETQEFNYRDTPVRNIIGSSPPPQGADKEVVAIQFDSKIDNFIYSSCEVIILER